MKSVLIVDDSRVSRKILRNILEHNGYAVADSKVRPYTKIRSCLDYEI